DGETAYETAGGARVDLHWRLLNDPRYRWNEAASGQVWDRAARIEVAGAPVLALAPEDLLLYLAVHLAVHHGLVGLVWYWDLALLLARRPLDWDAIGDRAARWRVRGALAFALAGVQATFGIAAPPDVAARLGARGARAGLLRMLLRRRPPDR